MKNRVKNLTPKQIQKKAFLITTVVSLVFIAIAIICCVLFDPMLIISLIIIWALLMIFIVSIFPDSSSYEEDEKKESVNTFLNKKEYTEILFSPSSVDSDDIEDSRIEMALAIFEAERCRFYGKITEDDNIRLIVKDKYDNKLYDTEIENYDYFNLNFKPKEN